jgi:hypothetical protein
MTRIFRALLLLSVLLWQTATAVGSMTLAQREGGLEHLIVHCEDANHHHHADNALHMDDDGGPVQHLHADTGNGSPALLTSQPPPLADVRSMSPPDKSYAAWLSPTLEGPLRPPMQRA